MSLIIKCQEIRGKYVFIEIELLQNDNGEINKN